MKTNNRVACPVLCLLALLGSAALAQGQERRRPVIVEPWIPIAGDPDLGELTAEKQQPVDFAIWQAADGSWQLWSCIRNTKEAGKTRLFHRWEGAKLTDANWKPMGIAMRADPKTGEMSGGLQAPHVIKVGDRYEMFYGGWEDICSASSRDGKSFERRLDAQGKATLFGSPEPYAQTRDPMVIRIGDLWHCYYTAHTGKKGADFCRTSKDLRSWSEARMVAAGGRSGDGSFSAECPFVVELEPGQFYLFRTQKYGKDAVTNVYFSRDPLDFGVEKDEGHFVCSLPVAAPEIIKHQGQYYIAALLPSLKGMQIARLDWAIARSDEYADFNPGDNSERGSEWVKSIQITSPALRSEIKGDVKVEFAAPGMTAARAYCWQQPTPQQPDAWGHDVNLAPELKLDGDGNGSFVFPAEQFPNGPINIRITAANAAGKRDIRELQLYNTGGVAWNQGIPRNDPPAAKGMKLLFSDDFDGELSISSNGKGKRYMAHKPGGGDFSGYLFTGPEGPKNPFSQKGTFLRIHAKKNAADPKDKGSTGIIAPVESDFGKGVFMTAPYYVECRFTAQSAPGTWPAFWVLAKRDQDKDKKKAPCDELDIIEAYGGVGKKNPNAYGFYSVTTHFWNQTDAAGKPFKPAVPTSKRIDMMRTGGKSSWSTTFHTYGLLVTRTDTVYYLDDVEVLRFPTGNVSKTGRHFFMINYAIGGISGWQIDLEREGHASDMWVDYVRAYQGTAE